MRNLKPQPPPDHDSVVADWQQNAEARVDKNFEFLHSLKWKDYDFEPDDLADELHRQAFQIVDCTRCTNCCRTATVILDQEDVDRIAARLGIAAQEFIEKYLERDEIEGGFAMRQKPYPLLGDDNRCTVYEVRPTNCRGYPNTDKKCFARRVFAHAANSLMCPAVFWIVEQMRQRARRRRR